LNGCVKRRAREYFSKDRAGAPPSEVDFQEADFQEMVRQSFCWLTPDDACRFAESPQPPAAPTHRFAALQHNYSEGLLNSVSG
jgi:hypothetical protein